LADIEITETSIVSRAPDVIATELDGEAVLMSIARGQCYGFDAIGTRIWSMIERPAPVGEMLARLVGEYNVAPEICRQDLTRLLAELARERLIFIGNEQAR
jgi:hypothetical protein